MAGWLTLANCVILCSRCVQVNPGEGAFLPSGPFSKIDARSYCCLRCFFFFSFVRELSGVKILCILRIILGSCACLFDNEIIEKWTCFLVVHKHFLY